MLVVLNLYKIKNVQCSKTSVKLIHELNIESFALGQFKTTKFCTRLFAKMQCEIHLEVHSNESFVNICWILYCNKMCYRYFQLHGIYFRQI